MINLFKFIENILKQNNDTNIIIEGGYFTLFSHDSDFIRINNLKQSINLSNKLKDKYKNINIIHSLFVNDMESMCTKNHTKCNLNNKKEQFENNEDLISKLPSEAIAIYNSLNNIYTLRQKATKNKSSKIIKKLIKNKIFLKNKNIFLYKEDKKTNIILNDNKIILGYKKDDGGVVVGCPSIMGQHYRDLISLTGNNFSNNLSKLLLIDFNNKEEINVVKDGIEIYKNCFKVDNADIDIINVYNDDNQIKFYHENLG